MVSTPAFDPALQRRYDRPGPRYTSYPTAPRFQPGFAEAQLAESKNADALATAERAASLAEKTFAATDPRLQRARSLVVVARSKQTK